MAKTQNTIFYKSKSITVVPKRTLRRRVILELSQVLLPSLVSERCGTT